MLEYLRRHLGAKLFISYVTIILVGLVILTAASQFALPSSFDRHMLRLMSNPGGMAPGMGLGPGRPGAGNQDFRSQLFVDYRAGFNDFLLVAGVVALLAALLLSLFLSRSVTEPVQAMSRAAQRIAAGHYDERVSVAGQDELSQLASRFNQMAERLSEVESMRRRLIADVSHELRTPLTAIQGSVEGLMDGVLPPADETYRQIHSEAERLNRLVDDLQELSRVEANANELRRERLDVATVVQTVGKRLEPQAAARGIVIDTEVEPHLPQVLGDEDRLVQVLSNLTNNALQYTPAKGRVTIVARRAEGEVQISVADTGIGIASLHLQHVFDRFYRADKSRSRQAGGGSGIGLTIARALVEAHGGRIWAESEGEGRGSTFTFTLPIEP